MNVCHQYFAEKELHESTYARFNYLKPEDYIQSNYLGTTLY